MVGKELREYIYRTVTEILAGNSLNEMAVDRGMFCQYGLNQSATVLEHIGLICVFENDFKMSHWVSHWQNEIAMQIYDIGKIDVKNDNRNCKIKKKAFIHSFIEGRLGADFSEYEMKMPSYIKDGLEKEGLSKEQIRKIDIDRIVAENKERIRKYLFSFVDLLSIKDLDELKEQCNIVARKF